MQLSELKFSICSAKEFSEHRTTQENNEFGLEIRPRLLTPAPFNPSRAFIHPDEKHWHKSAPVFTLGLHCLGTGFPTGWLDV